MKKILQKFASIYYPWMTSVRNLCFFTRFRSFSIPTTTARLFSRSFYSIGIHLRCKDMNGIVNALKEEKKEENKKLKKD